MPAVQSKQLVDAILDAVQDSGGSAILVSPLREHPRKFSVTQDKTSRFSLWVYAWTLTRGGRPSLPHEYRIQLTTVESPLNLNLSGPTVLIGYDPDLKMFAGFDITRHQSFTRGSPSVQIDRRIVEQALQDGMAFDRKSNNEIAVAFRPDQFVAYAECASDLHRYGREAMTLSVLRKASSLEPIMDDDIQPLNQVRRRVIERVSRLAREAAFARTVLHAYGFRCAVTKMQLRSVDAAHILPVGAPNSPDDVRNGIALSPTYHRAYDNGLIYLDEGWVMRLNAKRESELKELNLAGGLDSFKWPLGKVLLPPDRRQWPHKSYIMRANRLRRIS